MAAKAGSEALTIWAKETAPRFIEKMEARWAPAAHAATGKTCRGHGDNGGNGGNGGNSGNSGNCGNSVKGAPRPLRWERVASGRPSG